MTEGAGSGPVGLIGAGLIGTALARRLLAAGFEVLVFDIDPVKALALASEGARIAASPAEVAGAAQVVVLAVFDTAQVEAATEGPGGLAESWAASGRRDPVAVAVSTCDPERIEALGGRLSERGTDLVECPLSGTSGQVAAGDGVGLVAGREEAIGRAEAVLAVLAPRRFRLGRLGNGNRAKLAVNLILGLNRAALAEGLVFAERMGLPLGPFLDVARGSAAQSQVMDIKGPKMIAGDTAPEGRIRQSAKDFALMLEAAGAAGQILPLATVYAGLMEGCLSEGAGDHDNSAVIDEIRRRRTDPSRQ